MQIIKKQNEFKQIYQKHEKLEGKYFLFFYQKIPEDLFKVGIVVNKKVGKAVVRNKIRRRIKAFFQQNQQKLPEKIRLLIIAKWNSGKATWQEICDDIARGLQKIADENLE
ncbi:MAG TPA: ribonuclease P protein component [Candidatus Cloacimonas sp.]|jgi:ribonuclease P protein component|nr:ribonuclease protein component [Candidatus Cloacimonadota bacterium]HCX73867.1 ribonuclease P protein component [Candidatus Cloacimonas sp.]